MRQAEGEQDGGSEERRELVDEAVFFALRLL